MKKLTLALALALAFSGILRAQNNNYIIVTEPLDSIPAGYELVDSIVYVQAQRVETTLKGRNIFAAMPENVNISQTDNVEKALRDQIHSNKDRQVDGYRIRIFLDNKQNSREMSAKAVEDFNRLYPGYNAYRSFKNPFFKVTVGDFRTKADAQIALKKIVRDFPAAFVVKEKMKYPVIDIDNSIQVDTLHFLRPIAVPDQQQ